jgi:transcriptional regulator with GAF, ATPase, and Fis domain
MNPREAAEALRMIDVLKRGRDFEAKPLVSTSPARDPRFAEIGSERLGQIGSVVFMPLFWEEELLGGIYVESASERGYFRQPELHFLVAFATVASMAVQEMRLEAARSENLRLRREITSRTGFAGILTQNRRMLEIIELIDRLRDSTTTVLFEGETGTGKELLAHAIHDRSPRRDRVLVKVNCAALPPTLIESELFGHEKGAFTGATATRPGRFELADGGTLFLDEIAELPVELQPKLLRVLQDGEFQRVGGTRTYKVDVRLVAATNRDLLRAIDDGRFRDDLYYRVAAFPIHVPPLRDRREDIPLLVWSIIERRQIALGRRIDTIPTRVMDALRRYDWPGNVRELQNVVERALILSPGAALRLEEPLATQTRRAPDRLDQNEREHILRILERCRWRINGEGNAAAVLGLEPSTLRSRMQKLGIRRPARPQARDR